MNGKPVFPRWGEPHVECDICGFEFPKSKIRRDHLGRLACPEDVDARDRDSYRRDHELPEELGFGEPIEGGEED